MEPITATLVTALIAGAAAAATDVASDAIQSAYTGLKNLVIQKLGGRADVENAVQQVEAKPDSPSRQGMLQEEVEAALTADPAAAQDAELRAQAEALLSLLEQAGRDPAAAVQIQVTGSGAAAYGAGAKAAGERGVVADQIEGGVATGDHARQIRAETYHENPPAPDADA